jgi:hypothetical protein
MGAENNIVNSNRKHSLLSPSTAHRWINCTPSVYNEQFEDQECSVYAQEGTDAHKLAEEKLRLYFNVITEKDYDEFYAEFKETSEFWNTEFEEYVDAYCNDIKTLYEEHKNEKTIVIIEAFVTMPDIDKDMGGTADFIMITEDTLFVRDLKFGKGVPVSAYENEQMKLYAYGALQMSDIPENLEKINLGICQVRVNSYQVFETTKTELQNWVDTVVKPAALLAKSGQGTFKAEEHACRFCRLRGKCAAQADANMKALNEEFKEDLQEYTVAKLEPNAQLLDTQKLVNILQIAPAFIDWFKDIQAYAYKLAINGTKIPGYKLVEGRSVRKIIDDLGVIEKAKELKVPLESVAQLKLKGITELEKVFGKKVFTEEFGDYIVKPQGAVTLVPESDRRPEVSGIFTASSDFSDE